MKSYSHRDLILPTLSSPCDVKVSITDKHLFLHIGPRDWQWDLESERFIGAGTLLLNDWSEV